MIRTVPVSLMILALGFAAGCAASLPDSGCGANRADWIEQTLVTVDVTGTWQSIEGFAMRLVLEQQGKKVTGRMFVQPSSSSAGADIEGSVAGDMFRFSPARGTSVVGDMRVSGDDMRGCLRGSVSRGEVRLQRVSSPASQP